MRGTARDLGLSRAIRATFRRAGYDLLRRHYYSPIPDLESLPREVWEQESEMPGVRFDPADGLKFVEAELRQYAGEYSPPMHATGDPRDFYLDNGLYESGDAELLYAMIRRYSPGRVLELGSGMSTLVIADARADNGRADPRDHVICDPFPQERLRAVLGRIGDLRALPATEVPLSEFQRLEAGDLLFVDTTHTVKIGGEVNRIILELLPLLAPGVIIHVHDIYLPFEYPREYLEERNFFWAEQYLLQAFLEFNERFEILFGVHALARKFPQQLDAMLPSGAAGPHPSAFWLRRSD